MTQRPEPPALFWYVVHAHADDIDELGHVNNAVYVRWLQDIATSHWRSVATAEMQARWFWLVVRHEIDYMRPTLVGEELTAETWCENAHGARIERRIDIAGADGRRRVSARTTWAMLDAELLRPARIPRDVLALFAP